MGYKCLTQVNFGRLAMLTCVPGMYERTILPGYVVVDFEGWEVGHYKDCR